VVTAAQLAAKLGISQRTLYRDIQDLSLAGVPILGEAGVGYRMGAGFDHPLCSPSMKSRSSLPASA
jgi:predicted DNA-binding transcriptional regulator YafY